MNLSIRPRRLRENPVLRGMVRETRLSPDALIYPIFVREGAGVREEIPSLPGQVRYTIYNGVPTVVDATPIAKEDR